MVEAEDAAVAGRRPLSLEPLAATARDEVIEVEDDHAAKAKHAVELSKNDAMSSRSLHALSPEPTTNASPSATRTGSVTAYGGLRGTA